MHKVYLITGSTSGIGKATARVLAQTNGQVVLVARDPKKGQAAAAEIHQFTGNSHLDLLFADLSAQSQVQSLAEQFLDRYDRLDGLINCAGGIFDHRQLSADGIEMTWALNHLSSALLTLLLLDTLKASAPSRIVNVSANAHRFVKDIHWTDVELNQGYNATRAYGQSKLANALFICELARRLEGTGVTANLADPGVARTNFGNNNSWIMYGTMKLIYWALGHPADRTARHLVHLLTAPEVEGITGQYFKDGRAIRAAPIVYDEAAGARLWDLTEAMTARVEESVSAKASSWHNSR